MEARELVADSVATELVIDGLVRVVSGEVVGTASFAECDVHPVATARMMEAHSNADFFNSFPYP